MLSLNTEHISQASVYLGPAPRHSDRNTTFLFQFSIIYLFFSNTVSTGQQMTNHIQFSYCIFEFINHSVGTPPPLSSGISINTTLPYILWVIEYTIYLLTSNIAWDWRFQWVGNWDGFAWKSVQTVWFLHSSSLLVLDVFSWACCGQDRGIVVWSVWWKGVKGDIRIVLVE